MVLCAQARCSWYYNEQCMWDGKMGMWPIGVYIFAQRKSHNRLADTSVWVNETKESTKYKELMIDVICGQYLRSGFLQDCYPARWHCVTWKDQLVYTSIKLTWPLCSLGLFNAIWSDYCFDSTHLQTTLRSLIVYKNRTMKSITVLSNAMETKPSSFHVWTRQGWKQKKPCQGIWLSQMKLWKLSWLMFKVWTWYTIRCSGKVCAIAHAILSPIVNVWCLGKNCKSTNIIHPSSYYWVSRLELNAIYP